MSGTEFKYQAIEIELKHIRTTQDDSRLKDIESLAASIASVGLMYPIVVQPIPDDFDNGEQVYELIDGHRRLVALKYNKAKTVRAIEIDAWTPNDKAATLQLTANLHRLPLTPFQEAAAIQKLREDGRNAQDIAADLGMTPQAVARRDQLNKLIPEWMKFIERMDEGEALSVAAFELIACYEPSIQGRLLSSYENSFQVPTVASLKNELSEFDRQLRSAPWKLDDAVLLPTAGACNDCQRRSSCQALLFDGETDGKKATPEDRCLDIECWDNKLKRFGEKKIEEAKAKHPDLVLINRGNNGPVVSGLSRKLKTITQKYEWEKKYEPAKKTDPDAVPAMTINEKGLGSISYIRIIEKKIPKATGNSKKSTGVLAETPEQKATRELKERRETWIRDKIDDATGWNSDPPSFLVTLPAEQVLALLGSIATCVREMSAKHLPKWASCKPDTAIREVWKLLAAHMYVGNELSDYKAVAEHVLRLKWSDLEAEALKAIPDPNPKAGATAKKVKKGK